MQNDSRPFRKARPLVFLRGATTPFFARTVAGRDGKFRFRKLSPAMYQLIVEVAGWGEMHQTVEIGPALADSRRRVEATFHFKPSYLVGDANTVSWRQLFIPPPASREYRRAEERLEERDVDRAIQHLEKAIEHAPHFSAAWNLLGTIAYQSQRYARAEQCFQEALELDPSFYPPLVNLGGALLALERAEDALTFNLQAVRARPGDALAHSQLGHNYFMLGRLGEAEQHLKKSKSLDPRHFSLPRLLLAEICDFRGDYQSAAVELRDFLRHHPGWRDAVSVARMLEEVESQMRKTSSEP